MSSSQLSPCVLRTRRWYSVFLLEAAIRSRVLFPGRRNGFETSLSRLLRTARRGSQVPVRSQFVDRNGIQPRVRQQAVTFVSTVARRTGMIVREAAGRRDTCAALKARRQFTSQTGSVTTFTCCNKEHSCPVTYSFYRCESCGHRITRASSMEPSSHPGHSLGHYTCPGRPMPQQSYPLYSNCRVLARIGSLVNCNLTHFLNLSYPANLT